MTILVFDTPGLLDKRGFTLMGVSAKLTKSPIGRFGTGLKYGVASLVRMGTEPVVWIGTDRYTFSKRRDSFRGVEFDNITMRRDRFGLTGRNTALPYTTSYGRDWKPWMVMREFESNTRDEGGTSYMAEEVSGVPGRTLICISEPSVIEAYKDIGSVFLPGALREGTGVEVLNRPSKYIYWRGMRVLEIEKEAKLTYNILNDMQLTEDRTLSSEWEARLYIAQWVTKEADAAQVTEVITAPEGAWEHEMDLNVGYNGPSDAFKETMVRYPVGTSTAASRYFTKHDDRISLSTFDVFEAHPKPWRVRVNSVVDATGREVFQTPYNYNGKWSVAAEQIVKVING